MRPIATNSLAASILGIGMAGLLVGCASLGESSTSTGSQVPGASVGTGSTTPTSGTPDSTLPSATPTGNGSVGGLAVLACKTSDLKVAQGNAGGAAGSVYAQIEFTNNSGRRCTLFGYPGVALTTDKTPNSQVGAAATRSAATPKKVITLAPGNTASATLQIAQVANYPSSRCEPVSAHYLQVYPPGQTDAVYLPYTGQGCSKPVFVLGIQAVQAGTGAA